MRFVNHTYVFRWGASGLLGLAVTLCLIACSSKELTQERTVEIVKSSKDFQETISITLRPEYRQSLTLIGTGSETTKKEEFALRRFLESHADLAVLHHLGLVNFRVNNIEYPNSASSPVTVVSSLTDQGRSASNQWQQTGNDWTITIAKKELIEVTGIARGQDESKTARVEYVWSWQPTSVGKSFDKSDSAYRGLPSSISANLEGASMADMMRRLGTPIVFDSSRKEKASAIFQHYDDGWRLVK